MRRKTRAKSARGPDSERMWRRLTSLFKAESDWERCWTANDIVEFLLKHEA